MDKNEIVAFLAGGIRQHELVLERVWSLRLSRRLDEARRNAPGQNQRNADCFVNETEERLADTRRLIVLYVPRVPDGGDGDIAEASVEVFERRATVIADGITASCSDYHNGKMNADLIPNYSAHITGKHAAAVMWDKLALREDVYRILAERAQMKAVLESAQAATFAAEAEQKSAEASVIAAEASKRAADLSSSSITLARKTETWTKWAAIATAVAAGGTLLAAIATAWTTWHIPSPDSRIQPASPAQTSTQPHAAIQTEKKKPT